MKAEQKTGEFYDQEASKYDILRWESEAGVYTNAVQKEIVGQLLGDTQFGNQSTDYTLSLYRKCWPPLNSIN